MTQERQKEARIVSIIGLSEQRTHHFQLAVDDALITDICVHLNLLSLRKLRMSVSLRRSEGSGWRLEGELGATAAQQCVISLEPVITRIDTTFTRVYTPDFDKAPAADEIEMPEDDTIEPLTGEIDLGALTEEVLSLELPDFPRAEGAELANSVFSGPGITPMTDADAHPFAALARLRKNDD